MRFERGNGPRDRPARDQPGQPQRASWRRQKGASAAGPTRGGPGERHAWEKGPAGGPRLFGERLKLTLYGLLAAAAVVFLVRLLWPVPRDTPLIALVLTEYVTPVPPNAYALEDIDRLQQANPENIPVITRRRAQGRPASRLGDSDALLTWIGDQLHNATPGGPGAAVVLYLSAHGVVNQAGDPCLLLENDMPSDSPRWLRVADLIGRIEADLAAHAERKVVLILDASRIDSNWNLGQLYNGFTDRLSELEDHLQSNVDGHGLPRLVILNSAGPGQIGWTSPFLRGSAAGGSLFGYVIARGLRGQADLDNDGTISLHELFGFVSRRVAASANEIRDAVQRPVMIPDSAPDMPLFYVDTSASERATDAERSPPASASPAVRWAREVADLWRRQAELRGRGACRFEPLGLAEAEHQLLRFEQLMLAGRAYRIQCGETRGRIAELLDRVEAACPPRQMPFEVFSIPLAEQLRAVSSSSATQSALFAAWSTLGRESSGVDRKAIREVLDQLAAGPAGQADLVEFHFLRMLDAYADWPGPVTAADVAEVVRDRDLAERAAAPADERTYYWVRALVNEADHRRRQAEDLLFVGDRQSLDSARKLWSGTDGTVPIRTAYEDAIARAEQVDAAYALRDRCWADAPYLIQWALDQERWTSAASADVTLTGDDVPPVERLSQWARDIHILSEAMDDALDDRTWKPADVRAYGELATAFDPHDSESLYGAFRGCVDEYDDPELRGLASTDVPALIALLKTPLLTPHERQLLFGALVALMQKLDTPIQADYDGPAIDRGVTAKVPIEHGNRDADYLAILTRQDEHPVLAILGQRQQADADSPEARGTRQEQLRFLQRQGGAIRALLAHPPTRSAAIAPQAARANSITDLVAAKMAEARQALGAAKDSATLAGVRRGLSEADRLARAAAVLLATGLRTEARTADGQQQELNPTKRLRDFDLHVEMLWHCRRTLDDFWGPRPAPDGHPRETASAFFQMAGQGYLRAARKLAADWGYDALGLAPVDRLLTRRQEAAAKGIQLRSSDVVLLEDVPSPHQVDVVSVAKDLPEGIAAVYVEPPAGAALEQLVSLPSATGQPRRRSGMSTVREVRPAPIRVEFAARQHLASTSDWQAMAQFRGHQWPTPFDVVAGGMKIVFQPEPWTPPRITVDYANRQDGAVVFVFDCSLSMKTAGRFQDAAGTLINILSQLQRSDAHYQIGFWLYGHRYLFANDWGKVDEATARLLTTDAQAMIHLTEQGELSDAQVRRVREILESATPKGITPLYYALFEALDDFRPLIQRPLAKQIVVITDGLNLQPRRRTPPQSWKTADDVADKWRKNYQDVQINIVGFGMNVGQNKQRDLKELHALANTTGGVVAQTDRPDRLLKALAAALELGAFRVRRDESTETSELLQLGATWQARARAADQLAGRPVGYRVGMAGVQPPPPEAAVALAGGESLKLFYDKTQNLLVHRRYGEWEDRAEDVVEAETGRHFFVAAGQPTWQRGDGPEESRVLQFSLSLQNQRASEFSPRPRHIWVDIRPEVAGRPPDDLRTYVFYDRDFQPGTPVPVLRFRVPDWPREATRANIRAWIRTEPVPSALEFQLADKVDRGPFSVPLQQGDENPIELEVVRGPAVAPATGRVIVIERHQGGNLDRVAVEMVPAPLRAVHTYLSELSQVRHTFNYTGAAPRIRVTSSRRIKQGAAAVVQPPLRVTRERL